MKESHLQEQAARISKDCIAVRVRLLNRIITNIYDSAMRPHGISLNQASILTIIMITPEPGFGEICRLLHMEKSTLSRNIHRMKNNGWIDTSHRDDAKGTVLRITPKGKRVLEKAHVAWEEAQDEAAGYLGPKGVEAVMSLAEKFWAVGMNQE